MPGNIAKRSNGKWRARYRDEGGKEHARHFARKVDAQRWLDNVTASIVGGNYVDPNAGKVTFGQWFARYSEAQVWAEGTRDVAARAASSVPFNKVPMARISSLHLQQWVKSMQQPAASRKNGLAASTIHTRFNFVHMAFIAAVKLRVIASDPCADVRLPRPRKASAAMTIPSPEQVASALRAAPESFAAYIAVCAFAGLRPGEAAGLQKADVDFLRLTLQVARQVQGTNADNTKVVPPKYESERTIHIPEELAQVIAEHVRVCGTHGAEGWLFADEWGRRVNRTWSGHQWRQVRKRTGLEFFTLHDLRHFYVSGLIASGCDVVTVQRAVGHSSATVTLSVYSHLWPDAADRTRAAAARLMTAVLSPADSLRTEGAKTAVDLRL